MKNSVPNYGVQNSQLGFFYLKAIHRFQFYYPDIYVLHSVHFKFLYVSALDGFISPQKKVAIAFSFDASSPSYQ